MDKKHVCLGEFDDKILQKDTSKSIDHVFFIFLEINEKKGVLKQNPLNKKSRKLLDELCGRQQCKFKIVDDFTIKNVDHGNDQV